MGDDEQLSSRDKSFSVKSLAAQYFYIGFHLSLLKFTAIGWILRRTASLSADFCQTRMLHLDTITKAKLISWNGHVNRIHSKNDPEYILPPSLKEIGLKNYQIKINHTKSIPSLAQGIHTMSCSMCNCSQGNNYCCAKCKQSLGMMIVTGTLVLHLFSGLQERSNEKLRSNPLQNPLQNLAREQMKHQPIFWGGVEGLLETWAK